MFNIISKLKFGLNKSEKKIKNLYTFQFLIKLVI